MLIDNSITNEALTEIYQGFFNFTPCLTCPGGREDAILKIREAMAKQKENQKTYQFKDEYKGYTVNIAGIHHGITAENLTDELAQKLIDAGLGNYLEEKANGQG